MRYFAILDPEGKILFATPSRKERHVFHKRIWDLVDRTLAVEIKRDLGAAILGETVESIRELTFNNERLTVLMKLEPTDFGPAPVCGTFVVIDPRFSQLTPREKGILSLVALGDSNEEIAAKLKVSVSTVRTHRRRVWEKLGVETKQQFLLAALELRDVLHHRNKAED